MRRRRKEGREKKGLGVFFKMRIRKTTTTNTTTTTPEYYPMVVTSTTPLLFTTPYPTLPSPSGSVVYPTGQ